MHNIQTNSALGAVILLYGMLSARVVKTLMGNGTIFHAYVRRDGHYIIFCCFFFVCIIIFLLL